MIIILLLSSKHSNIVAKSVILNLWVVKCFLGVATGFYF